MKTARKIISLLLVLALVAAWMPAQAFAVTTGHAVHQETAPKAGSATVIRFNPLYPAPDVTAVSNRLLSSTQPASGSGTDYSDSLEEVADIVRDGLVDREASIALRYQVPASAYDGSQADTDALITGIFDAAVVHTGVPTEGDALLWVYEYYQASLSYWYMEDSCYIDITFTVSYYTHAVQEAVLNTAVNQLLDELAFTEKTSDYEKVKAIYDYICANVTYDYDNLYDDSHLLKYTAYAALINGTAVCQGYALLMYRLLLEVGVDCRVVAGIGNGGPHSWNIVKLGEYYYNLDSTWDAGFSEYGCFLRSEENFTDHYRYAEYATEEFYEQYPMDSFDYDPETSHTHTYDNVVVTPPTCTKEGYTTYICTFCGLRYTDNYTEPTGHSYDEGTTYPPTCGMEGHTVYICSACGYVHVDDFVEKLPHTYDAGVVTLPTCTEKGYTTYTCTVCGSSYKDQYVPESHNYVAEIKVVTCTDFGYTTFTCTYCGDSYIVDYVNPTGHTLGEDFQCTVCGRPEYVFNSELYVRTLILGEDGVYYTTYGDMVLVAVALQLDQWTVDNTLAENVKTFGESAYSLTYWDQILASLNEDGCLVLTSETLVWMLDLLKGDDKIGPEDWRLNYYLCYALDHVHAFETVVTPPTCTEFGLIETLCIHCGLVTESESTWYEHSYDEGVVTPPTCTSNGYTTYTCTVCGSSYESDYTPYADHTYGDDGVVTPPTCTTEGYTTYTCTQCNNWIRSDYVPVSEHTPDETCVCTICGTKVYLIDIGLELENLVLGKDGVYYTAYGDVVVIAVSAPLDNWLGGYSLYEYVDNFGSYYFSMTYWDELLDATDEDGYAPLTSDTLVWMLDLITGNPSWGEDETCLTYYIGFPVDHTHSYEVEEQEPTCTEMGYVVHACTECGIGIWEYTDALGHSLDENNVCALCGVKFDYLIACGLQVDDLILGENGIYYTADGYMAVIAVRAPLDYWLGGQSLADYVYVYGDRFFSLTYWDQLLAAANADGYAPLTPETLFWILDVITGNPVWGEDASNLTYYIGYDVRSATCEHSYTEVVTEPTCMGAGFTTYTCTLCGDSYIDNYTDPADHSYTTAVTEPSCAAWGYTTYTCTVCGYCYTADEVEPLGHSFEDVVTAPTCTAGGYTTHTCTACGGSYVDAYTDPVEHSYVDGACEYCGLAEVKTLIGDVNGDGRVNTSDAKLVMQYELRLIDADALDLAAADVNGDGRVNTSDAKLIMQMELGLITKFPGQE